MKKLIQQPTTLIWPLMVAMIAMTSCQKEAPALEPEVELPSAMALHKDIVVNSEDGISSMTIRVSADDQAIFDYFSETNFEITPIAEGQSIDAVLETKYRYDDRFREDPNEEEADHVEDDAPTAVAFEIIQSNKGPGVSHLALTFIQPENSTEKTDLFGSFAANIFSPIGWVSGEIESARITKTNLLGRVKFGLKARPTRNDPYEVVVPEWRTMTGKSSYTHQFTPAIDRAWFRVRVGLLGKYTTVFTY